jgi:hypothetical protein
MNIYIYIVIKCYLKSSAWLKSNGLPSLVFFYFFLTWIYYLLKSNEVWLYIPSNYIYGKFIMSSLLFNLKMYNVIIFTGKNIYVYIITHIYIPQHVNSRNILSSYDIKKIFWKKNINNENLSQIDRFFLWIKKLDLLEFNGPFNY